MAVDGTVACLEVKCDTRGCLGASVKEQVDHTTIESTVGYLGVEVDDAIAIAEQVDA